MTFLAPGLWLPARAFAASCRFRLGLPTGALQWLRRRTRRFLALSVVAVFVGAAVLPIASLSLKSLVRVAGLSGPPARRSLLLGPVARSHAVLVPSPRLATSRCFCPLTSPRPLRALLFVAARVAGMRFVSPLSRRFVHLLELIRRRLSSYLVSVLCACRWRLSGGSRALSLWHSGLGSALPLGPPAARADLFGWFGLCVLRVPIALSAVGPRFSLLGVFFLDVVLLSLLLLLSCVLILVSGRFFCTPLRPGCVFRRGLRALVCRLALAVLGCRPAPCLLS